MVVVANDAAQHLVEHGEDDEFVVQDEVGGDEEVGGYGEQGEDLGGDEEEGEVVVLDEVEGDGSGIHFRAVFTQTALDGLIQDTRFEVVERPQREMTRFLGALIGTLRPWMQKRFMQRQGMSYWVWVQLMYTHPLKEIKDMDPPYLQTGTQLLINADEFEHHRDRIRELFLIRHAKYIRQSSGLVVVDILNFRFQVANSAPSSFEHSESCPNSWSGSMRSSTSRTRIIDTSGTASSTQSRDMDMVNTPTAVSSTTTSSTSGV